MGHLNKTDLIKLPTVAEGMGIGAPPDSNKAVWSESNLEIFATFQEARPETWEDSC